MRTASILAVLAATGADPASGQGAGAASTQLIGFADVNYVEVERGAVAEGFRLGQVSALVVAPLAPDLAFYGEFAAGAGHGGGLGFGIMRAVLRYEAADWLRLSAGRYHPAIGYWSTAFNHGVWLETSTGSPLAFDRGLSFVPGHMLGVRAEGGFGPEMAGLSYVAGIGNGRQHDLAHAGDDGDTNNHRAWLLALETRPARLFGLRLGGSLYGDRVPAHMGAVTERIGSVHAVWEKETPEVLAEALRIRHEMHHDSWTSDAYYVQAAYRLPVAGRAWKPYVRVERVDVPGGGPVLDADVFDYRAAIAGLRYDFSPFAALKAEYRSEKRRGGPGVDVLHLQASLTFGLAGQEAALSQAPAAPPGVRP